jgi:hypothetical protein
VGHTAHGDEDDMACYAIIASILREEETSSSYKRVCNLGDDEDRLPF